MNGTWSPEPPSGPGPDWTEGLAELRREIDGLRQEIEALKANPPVHVEYHFDQLKVSRLEGTLNIGLSPQGLPGLEGVEAGGPGPADPAVAPTFPGDPQEERIARLQRRIAAYMERQAPAALDRAAADAGISLRPETRAAVLQDVARQADGRVRYYARTTAYPEQDSPEERDRWVEDVIAKTTRDIELAFAGFAGSLGGREPGGPTDERG